MKYKGFHCDCSILLTDQKDFLNWEEASASLARGKRRTDWFRLPSWNWSSSSEYMMWSLPSGLFLSLLCCSPYFVLVGSKALKLQGKKGHKVRQPDNTKTLEASRKRNKSKEKRMSAYPKPSGWLLFLLFRILFWLDIWLWDFRVWRSTHSGI